MGFILLSLGFFWALFLLYVYRGQRSLLAIDPFPAGRASLSDISVILAVKDGEKDLRESLERLTRLPVEIIVVNDRSKDGTQKVIEEFGVKHVEITELPENWLGKVHALYEGSKFATKKFMLFMDPDIRVTENVLKKTVNLCESENLDHLALMPETKRGDFLLNIMMMTSKLLFTWSARPWLPIRTRPLKCIKGVGAFNLVRRSKFLETEGFEWLRMDVADDVALAQLIARNGGRSLLMKAGKEGPSLDWYADFNELVHGLEKNVVGGFTNYQVHMVVIMSFMSFLPLVMHVLSIGVFATFIFAFLVKRYTSYRWYELICFPLGIAILGFILIRSSVICFRQGGIRWSGTFYPLRKLKEGSRVILGF